MLASRGWLRFGGAILCIALAAAACGGAAGTDPAASTTAATAAASPSMNASQATDGASAAPDPAVRLSTALAPLRTAAAFEIRVEIDGNLVVAATGRSVGPASTSSVTTSGRTVDYVQIPPQTWAREPGASWVLLGSDAAPAAPLDVLAKPLTLGASPADAAGTSLDATYPAAALGLTGDPVAVTITIDASGLTFTYRATQSGHTTTSTTTLHAGSSDPIVPPTP